jgi:multidrug resistance efflux pump
LPVLLTAAACVFSCRQDEIRANSDPPPIEIRATVFPSQSITITSQIDGQVASVAAREGETIDAGTVLAQVANAAVERDAEYSRAQLDWIDARLGRGDRARRNTGSRSGDSLAISEKILELRRQRFDKMKELRKTNDITARELEYAEVEYLAALRDYNNERRVILGGTAPQTVDDAELLRIERRKIAAEQRFAAQRQAMLRVTSPISGVVQRVHVIEGQPVYPREPVADVVNLATMHVRGNVAPELLRYLRKGVRVDVRVFSVPARTFADEIESVIPAQGTSSPAVVVTIPNPDGSLQPNTEALITLRSLR